MTGCPHADCACMTRCLRAHCPATHLAEFDQLLHHARSDRAPGPVLTLVAEAVPTTCDGSYVCACIKCVGEKQERRETVPETIPVAQPWEARPSRHRTAA